MIEKLVDIPDGRLLAIGLKDEEFIEEHALYAWVLEKDGSKRNVLPLIEYIRPPSQWNAGVYVGQATTFTKMAASATTSSDKARFSRDARDAAMRAAICLRDQRITPYRIEIQLAAQRASPRRKDIFASVVEYVKRGSRVLEDQDGDRQAYQLIAYYYLDPVQTITFDTQTWKVVGRNKLPGEKHDIRSRTEFHGDNGWILTRQFDQPLFASRMFGGIMRGIPLPHINMDSIVEPLPGRPWRRVWEPDFMIHNDRIAILRQGQLTFYPLPALDAPEWFDSYRGEPGRRKPIRYDKKKTFAENLQRAGLGRVQHQMAHWPRPSVAISHAAKRETDVGASHFGGLPDLPPDQPWPQWQGRDMIFLAQISLAEVHAVATDNGLPAAGMLSFFLGRTEDGDSWVEAGTDPAQSDGWVAIHTADVAAIEQRSNANPVLPLRRLSFRACRTQLPSGDHPRVQALALDVFERMAYRDIARSLNGEYPEPDFWLGGYAVNGQESHGEEFCERASQGADPFDEKMPVPNAVDWVQLLQLNSDDNCGMLWGDGGTFHWYIREADLSNHRFDRTWVKMVN